MRIDEAQQEMRRVYLGGSVGTYVSAALWFASAAAGTWRTHELAVIVLIVGGMFIFPLTALVLRLLGRPAMASRANPLSALAIQVAFTVPLAIPLILAALGESPEWFYAGFLIVVGAHYLPFITLYGQPLFAVPAALMLGTGFVLPNLPAGAFSRGGWAGGAILLVSALLLTMVHRRESKPRPV